MSRPVSVRPTIPQGARHLLEQLGLSGDEDPARLSGGEARRAGLARVLAAAPDILLLDEPTNHLDLPAIEWLESDLAARRAAIVMISHDRRFLANLSDATTWLDRGRTRRLERGFAAFEAWRDEVLAEEERDRHKLDRKIAAEEDWLRYGVTARRKRNVRRLAELRRMRETRRTYRGALGKAEIDRRAGGAVGDPRARGGADRQGLRRPARRRRLLDPRPARRPHRRRRPERQPARRPSSTCSREPCRPTPGTSASAPTSRRRRSTSAATASIRTSPCEKR